MDMMEVGNGNLTVNEERSHFALWAIFKSMMILGNDIRRMTPEVKAIILTKGLIQSN